AAPATAVITNADATNSFFMILPRFLVRPCGLPVKKDDDHAISPAWYLERAVNAAHRRRRTPTGGQLTTAFFVSQPARRSMPQGPDLERPFTGGRSPPGH